MRKIFRVSFTDNTMQILEQPPYEHIIGLEQYGDNYVSVCNSPAIYRACDGTDAVEIFLRGSDSQFDNFVVKFTPEKRESIIKSLTLFSERYNWEFVHNLNERIIL